MADDSPNLDNALEEVEPIPTPYRTYNHPALSWTEFFLSNLLSYLISFTKLISHEPSAIETKVELENIRTKSFHGRHGMMGKLGIKNWMTVSQCHIAEYVGEIPFQDTVLQKWNIMPSDIGQQQPQQSLALPESIKNRKGVKVLVRFPSTLLPLDVRTNAEKMPYSGCLKVEELDLQTFAMDVPILLQFHGGGLMMGAAHNTELINETVGLLSTYSEQGNIKETAAPPNLVTVSVEYGLAPEDRFPTGIMDALSVVDYFLSDNTNRKVHITGGSAGGNIALIAGLESYRQYPGRILTIQSQSPMIKPAGDSMSYYMNQNVFPDMGWLRWCWRAYLDLPKPPAPETTSPKTIEQTLRDNSNFIAWEEWKSKTSSVSIHRLVDPTYDMPSGLDHEEAPHFIVSANLADPLLDDGTDAATALQNANAKVTFLLHTGIHCDVGGEIHVDAYKKRLSLWSTAMFGSK